MQPDLLTAVSWAHSDRKQPIPCRQRKDPDRSIAGPGLEPQTKLQEQKWGALVTATQLFGWQNKKKGSCCRVKYIPFHTSVRTRPFYLLLSLKIKKSKFSAFRPPSLPPSAFCSVLFPSFGLKIYNFFPPITLTSCSDFPLLFHFFPSMFSPLWPWFMCDSSRIGISSAIPDASTTHNIALVLTCTVQEEGSWKTSK